MWGVHWPFWMMVFLVWMLVLRRRRWRRYAVRAGAYPPWALGPSTPWWDAPAARRDGRTKAPAPWRELEEQRGYVDALETRVAQLEERLDFAERLLAGRRGATSAGTTPPAATPPAEG